MDEKQTLPIVIHDSTLSMIYNFYEKIDRNDTALAYGAYTFLYKTARIQNNIRVYASDSFIRKGTGIGRDVLLRVKRDLKAMGLIEVIRPRDKRGHFSDHSYIEVKLVWKPEKLKKLFYQESSEMTRYKIARELLKQNFDDYEVIESNQGHEFEITVNGVEQTLIAENFYLVDDLLKCDAEFNTGATFEYTVPEDRAGEIMIELAKSYKFNFAAIERVLNMEV